MGEPNKAPDTITRVAQYECTQSRWEKRLRPYGIEGETEDEIADPSIYKDAPVTIRVIPNEASEETERRFRQAAAIELRGMVFRREMSECRSSSFKRFLPTAQEALKANQPNVTWDVLTRYANSMDTCRQALGSSLLCKPQP